MSVAPVDWKGAASTLAASWTGSLARRLLEQVEAQARDSLTGRAVARAARTLTGTARSRRGGDVLVTAAIAVAGHLVMASRLPATVRPTLALSAAALLAAILAAVAATARSR